jgi:hypothetical protein
MNGNQLMELPRMASLVRTYQRRWEFCLDRKTHSYYWRGKAAQQD